LASAPTHKVSRGLAPTLPFSSLFRFQKEARDDILGFMTKWAELGGVARFESRFFVAYLVTAPEAVHTSSKKTIETTARKSAQQLPYES
jgi:hypothetical protein